MKHRIPTLVLLGVLSACVATTACGGNQKGATSDGKVERVEGVEDAVAAFKQKDPSIAQLFSSAAGYVVFPTVGEGGFIIGGGHGSGEAYEGGAYTGRVTVSELSVGAQVGGQSYSQVVFFETPVDFKRLKENQFKFDAEVSAVAADQGVAKNAKFNNGIMTFIIPKGGLMAAASVGGQKLDFTPAK
jgi:lipid-binding SYLF domain-containing protein